MIFLIGAIILWIIGACIGMGILHALGDSHRILRRTVRDWEGPILFWPIWISLALIVCIPFGLGYLVYIGAYKLFK